MLVKTDFPNISPDMPEMFPSLDEAFADDSAKDPIIVEDVTPTFLIYTNSRILCPFCERAKQDFRNGNYTFEERDVADSLVRAELTAARPTARTVPQIFLRGGYYIGGSDELHALIERGMLDLIIEANT